MRFAEHNFGPFGHIFFVIVLFKPESKTLFRMLFSSLCLEGEMDCNTLLELPPPQALFRANLRAVQICGPLLEENTPGFGVSRDQPQPGSFRSRRASEGKSLGTRLIQTFDMQICR